MLRHKEDDPADAQAGKRQRTAAGAVRQPPSAAPPPPPPEEEPMDYKGKGEELMECIHSLCWCIHLLLDSEEAPLPETEARLSVLDEHLEDLKSQEVKRLNDQIKVLQDTNNRLQEYQTSLQQYNINLQEVSRKSAETIDKLQEEKNRIESRLKDDANSLQMQLKLAKCLHREIVEQKNALLKEVEGLRMKNQHAREYCENKSAEVDSLRAQIRTYEEMTRKTAIEQKKELESLRSRLEEAEQQILDGEELRKKLHNTILELKGNIRVFCRVRPLLPNEPGAISYPKSGENIGHGIELTHSGQAHSFTFDKVFDHSVSQEEVFIEISQLVQSALDGYKVCIFAYGQTGSGKSYTMMGNPELDDQKGMIPRSLEQNFQASQALNSQGWKYTIQASMLEMYNDTIRDLLAADRMAAKDGGSSKYAIKLDANGNSCVQDLLVVDVTSINEVSSLLRRAALSRSVGRTQMNEESSRSHCVFTLQILGVHEGTGKQVQGVLNLIDLAGSERLDKSGATGDRLKETQAINKSLSYLSDVISAIAKKQDHVPFRNSKLTHLLQPYLGRDSKTLMFVNLSPEVSSSDESIYSLRFGARVNSCETGMPRRQTQTRSRS